PAMSTTVWPMARTPRGAIWRSRLSRFDVVPKDGAATSPVITRRARPMSAGRMPLPSTASENVGRALTSVLRAYVGAAGCPAVGHDSGQGGSPGDAPVRDRWRGGAYTPQRR